MRLKPLSLALGLLIAFSGEAKATGIEYIFAGTGTGTLGTGGTFDGAFTVTAIGDTSTALPTGPNFFQNTGVTVNFLSGALSATLTGAGVQVISGLADANGSSVSFFQLQPAPVFAVNIAGFNQNLNSYDLTTAFPQTGTNPSSETTPFLTNNGDLSFTSISTMTFEADLTPTPLPASLPMFLVAFAGLAFFGYQRSRA